MRNRDLVYVLAAATKRYTTNRMEKNQLVYVNTFDWAMEEIRDYYPSKEQTSQQLIDKLEVHKIYFELNYYRKKTFWAPFPKEELLALDQIIDILDSVDKRFG